jgi:ribosomal-protein-serine acetyltransferase
MFNLEIDADLELRLLTEAHTERLHQLIEQNRDHLRVWLPWVDGTRTLEDTRRFIRFGLRQQARGSGMNAGIWCDQQLAGVIGYNYIDLGRLQAELGYWLGTAWQGRGIMTAASRAMTSYAFDRLGLQRVEICCAVDNLKSRAIPERLGFALEAITPQFDWTADRYIDTAVYSMAAADWQEREIFDGRENHHRRQF